MLPLLVQDTRGGDTHEGSATQGADSDTDGLPGHQEEQGQEQQQQGPQEQEEQQQITLITGCSPYTATLQEQQQVNTAKLLTQGCSLQASWGLLNQLV